MPRDIYTVYPTPSMWMLKHIKLQYFSDISIIWFCLFGFFYGRRILLHSIVFVCWSCVNVTAFRLCVHWLLFGQLLYTERLFGFLLQLLHDQVGVVNFQPYKQLFMHTFGRSRTCFTALPSVPALFGHPDRNWSVCLAILLEPPAFESRSVEH